MSICFIMNNSHHRQVRGRCESGAGCRNLRQYGIVELAGLVTAGGQRQTFVPPGLQEHHETVPVAMETQKVKVIDADFF